MPRLTVSLALPAVAVGLIALAPGAAAQNPATDHLSALKACEALQSDQDRLACFDRAVPAMVADADGGQVKIINQNDMRQTRRRLFGFSLPDIGIFGGDDGEDDELQVLESTITSVRYSQSDAFTFRIEDGSATWQVTNAPKRLREVKAGDKVEFKKAALGSYFIRFNGQVGVKGRRIQ